MKILPTFQNFLLPWKIKNVIRNDATESTDFYFKNDQLFRCFDSAKSAAFFVWGLRHFLSQPQLFNYPFSQLLAPPTVWQRGQRSEVRESGKCSKAKWRRSKSGWKSMRPSLTLNVSSEQESGCHEPEEHRLRCQGTFFLISLSLLF